MDTDTHSDRSTGASDVYQIDIAVASETLFLAGGIHNSDYSNALDTLLAYIEEGN